MNRPKTPGQLRRVGSGTPGAGLGLDGDIYLDRTTGREYEKIDGTWGLVFQAALPTTKLTGTIDLATQVSGSLNLATQSSGSISSSRVTGLMPAGYVDLGTFANASTINIDASLGDIFFFNCTGATQTIANPTNPTTGQRITLVILQTGFGTPSITWGTAWKLASGAWSGSLGSGLRGTINFFYDGAAWREYGGRASQVAA